MASVLPKKSCKFHRLQRKQQVMKSMSRSLTKMKTKKKLKISRPRRLSKQRRRLLRLPLVSKWSLHMLFTVRRSWGLQWMPTSLQASQASPTNPITLANCGSQRMTKVLSPRLSCRYRSLRQGRCLSHRQGRCCSHRQGRCRRKRRRFRSLAFQLMSKCKTMMKRCQRIMDLQSFPQSNSVIQAPCRNKSKSRKVCKSRFRSRTRSTSLSTSRRSVKTTYWSSTAPKPPRIIFRLRLELSSNRTVRSRSPPSRPKKTTMRISKPQIYQKFTTPTPTFNQKVNTKTGVRLQSGSRKHVFSASMTKK